MPTPLATYYVQLTPQNTTTLTTASFTGVNGQHLVVKMVTWDSASPLGAPTGGSQTYTSRVINAPGGFNQWCAIYTTTVSGSPGTMAVSSVPSVSLRGSMLVEVWPAGSLAGSPVTASSASLGAPVAGSFTPSAGTSAISWCGGDVGSADPATRAYAGSGTDEGVRDDHVGSNGVDYYAYQQASGTGAQTYGLTLPASTTYVIAGIEILAVGSTNPDPVWAPHRLVPPGRISPAGFWTPWTGAPGVGGTASISLADTGAETEALTATATAPLADTASETEALTVATAVPLVDTGSETEALTAVVTAPLADAASETEALTAAVTLALADAGSAADTLTVAVAVPLADAGSETEALTATATVPLADTGSASDALDNGLGTSKSLADTGSAADTLSVTVTVALADAASSAEALTATATVPLADTGSASDAVDNGLGTNKPLADTGSETEALTVSVSPALADSASGTDALGVTVAPALADSASSSATFAVAAAAPLADSGSASESLSVLVTLALADAGSCVDTAVGQDNAFTTKFLNDAGSAADALYFVPSLITGRPGVTGDAGKARVTGDAGTASVTGVY